MRSSLWASWVVVLASIAACQAPSQRPHEEPSLPDDRSCATSNDDGLIPHEYVGLWRPVDDPSYASYHSLLITNAHVVTRHYYDRLRETMTIVCRPSGRSGAVTRMRWRTFSGRFYIGGCRDPIELRRTGEILSARELDTVYQRVEPSEETPAEQALRAAHYERICGLDVWWEEFEPE